MTGDDEGDFNNINEPDESKDEFGERWNPDRIIDSLAEEKSVFGISDEKLAEKMFRENAARATDAIVWLALYSKNEKLRFDAARYITDRVLGKVNDSGLKTKNDVYDDFLESVTVAKDSEV
jgi:hypothetical protein